MYKMLRAILFFFDPEWVHYFSMNSLRFLCRIGFKPLLRSWFTPSGNNTYKFLNIRFRNKVGLGAGFDKNARYLNELEALGFGFVEIGTVTPFPQKGNDKPRLFRLPKNEALINRMGFNNDGVAVIVANLRAWNDKTKNEKRESELIIGGNIGKNKITPNEDAWKDYETCFVALHDHVHYFVVNVSSPNTPGLRELQEKDALRKILVNLQRLNSTMQVPKPILLKIAPDLSWEQIDDVISLAMEIKLDGLVATNTTLSRQGLTSDLQLVSQAGGLSGRPLQQRSSEIVQYIHGKTAGNLPIIGSGGIFTGADAKQRILSGATLVQVWTGFVYKGPGIVKEICRAMA